MINLRLDSTKSLASIFRQNAKSLENKIAVTFIDELGIATSISWLDLYQKATNCLHKYIKQRLTKGEIILIALPYSQQLIFAFWGAILGGMIPAILSPLTEKLDPELYAKNISQVIKFSGAKSIVAENSLASLLDISSIEGFSVISPTEELENSSLVEDSKLEIDPNAIAILQHSSGTTGLQKGVALPHSSIINQINNYSSAINLNSDDVIVSWLPLYHDMGLIAGFIFPILSGIPLVLMSPFYWVRDPKQLLLAISQYKGTLSWVPNFALNHMVRAISPRHMEGIQLASLRALINCSEPVQFASHQAFQKKFAPFGLRENALASCYAMAENTFAITQSDLASSPKADWVSQKDVQSKKFATPLPSNADGAISFVSCGKPIEGVQISIRDDEGNKLTEREIGNIFVKSNSMLSGYHHRPNLTANLITNGWYESGDKGYIANHELFISGRTKDLIIVGGKNIFPQDLEEIANRIAGIHPGRAVAFGLLDNRIGSEAIVLVCELSSDNQIAVQDIEIDLRQKISKQIEISIKDVRFVENRWVIKTSSGKIAREANKEKYIQQFS